MAFFDLTLLVYKIGYKPTAKLQVFQFWPVKPSIEKSERLYIWGVVCCLLVVRLD